MSSSGVRYTIVQCLRARLTLGFAVGSPLLQLASKALFLQRSAGHLNLGATYGTERRRGA